MSLGSRGSRSAIPFRSKPRSPDNILQRQPTTQQIIGTESTPLLDPSTILQTMDAEGSESKDSFVRRAVRAPPMYSGVQASNVQTIAVRPMPPSKGMNYFHCWTQCKSSNPCRYAVTSDLPALIAAAPRSSAARLELVKSPRSLDVGS